MTARKADIKLARTPRYVCRETGAAELEISPETWDKWVDDGRLPAPAAGFPVSTPRWRWKDVDRKLSGKPLGTVSAFIAGVDRLLDGEKKGRRRAA